MKNQKNKKPIISLNEKDFKFDYFSGTGAGGQHRNKHKNCVRIVHSESGAVSICQDYKSKEQNKKKAFERLVKNSKFNIWINKKVINNKKIEKRVDELMKPQFLKIEYL